MTGHLVIFAGLPASGKTTLANVVQKYLLSCLPERDDGVIIIDPDIFRTEENPDLQFIPEHELEVRQHALENVTDALRNGQVVIMDDLNYYQNMRHKLFEIASELKVPSVLVYVNTPLETCLKWNVTRDNGVPTEIVEKIANKFDYFKRYAWDRPDFTVDPSSPDFSATAFLKELCTFMSQNTSPRLLNPASRKKRRKLPTQSIKERFEIESRHIVSDFFQGDLRQEIRQKVLQLRKDLLQEPPQTLEEMEVTLSKFKEMLDSFQRSELEKTNEI